MSVGALNMHSMQVKCEVEADPADSVKFHWTYNNTRNVSPVSNGICDVKSGKTGLEMLVVVFSYIFQTCEFAVFLTFSKQTHLPLKEQPNSHVIFQPCYKVMELKFTW